MNRKTIIIASLAAIAAFFPSSAQNLSTEVVVDRTVEPEQRAASRLAGLTPQLVLPQAAPTSLRTARYTSLSPITRSYSSLSPIDGAFSPEPTPWRGYASVGYFYKYNIEANAGYRFLNDSTRLAGVDLQFNNEKYNPLDHFKVQHEMQRMAFRANGYYGWKPDEKSKLMADFTYRYLSQGSVYWLNQHVNSFAAHGRWDSALGKFDYSIGLDAAFENDGNTVFNSFVDPSITFLLDAINQIRGGLDATVSYKINENSRLGGSLYGKLAHTDPTDYASVGILTWPNHTTIGYYGAHPFYELRYGGLTAQLGLKVEMGINDDPKVHVAPDVNIEWAVAPQFSVWARATGGDYMNTFDLLRDITDYQLFTQGYRRSHIQYMLEGGLCAGPFAGFSAEIFGGYAKADEWLMIQRDLPFFKAYDIRGYRAGLRLGYEWRWLRASASGAISPGKVDEAWIFNRDRAKYVVEASVEARPIERLTVGLDYELRLDRYCYPQRDREFALGDVNLLNAHAAFAITPRFSVFARAQNLLNHRYLYLPYQPSQKLTALIGLTAKF